MASSIFISLMVLVIVCVNNVCVESNYIAYNTGQGVVPGKLNVHVVPHTHDDVGWLKTVEQYYVGANNSIQLACVQSILDSVMSSLRADKNRKFVYAEQAFFQRWWRDQNEATKLEVKQYVTQGRLEFINGGWCMHDEAATHYIDMIDQTTLGHRFIKTQFNVTPRVGWQIDPFGHSAVQAYLMGAEVGFDSFFFGRIDYQDATKRRSEKRLENIWQGSKSLSSSAQVFAGVLPDGYEPPRGFYFEVNQEPVKPVQDDDIYPFDNNVKERVNDFIAAAYEQANYTRGNHIMFTMGTDFMYKYAESWFRNLDKLIHYVNLDGRINALYSTPSLYTDAKNAETNTWPLKVDDFFPYADRINAYWTGYFTSRPAFKGYIRSLSAYFLAARQLEFFKGRNKAKPSLEPLAEALGVVQHHDGISGTEKQHVADDYSRQLSVAYKEAEVIVSDSLACLVKSASKSGCGNSTIKFQQCPLMNITYCPPTEVDLSQGKKLVVVVYNSLGRKRVDIIKIPVINENITVYDSRGKEIQAQLIPIIDASIAKRNFYATAYLGKEPSTTPKYWLAFTATVPPLGFNTYVISSTKQPGATLARKTLFKTSKNKNSSIAVGTGNLKLFYSGNGALSMYSNSRSSINASVNHSYSYYIGHGYSDMQASGAYIFRPEGSINPIKSQEQTTTILSGPLYDEIHQKINSWIYQITRVYKDKEHAEFEFTVGPIPTDDYVGKEIVTQFSTTTKNNKAFFTDSNGRDFLERIRDYRADWNLEVNQPVAGNYYPINLGIYMKDNSSEFSVLVDRAVGGSSIVDGQLELMLHRRLMYDDGRGVAEALDESVCVGDTCEGLTIQGKYYLRIDPLGEGAKWRRSYGQEIYSPLLLAFTEQDGDKSTNIQVPTFSAMDPSYSLPDNVALITLQELEDGKVLLRLAHLYEIGEDKDLSVFASVELKKLFYGKKIIKVVETSLSANQGREEMEKKRLAWKVEGSKGDEPKALRGAPVNPTKLVVELAPMEIRTFVIDLNHKR